jgi:hypothetical protein
MAVVVAVPAMAMMMVSNFNDHLAIRCGDQWQKEHKSEKAKRKFLHNHGMPLL